MALTPEQVAALDAPLDKKRIAQRTDKGRALDYLETYDVIDAANRIFGYDGWGYRVLRLEQVASGTYVSDKGEKPWALFEAEVDAWLTNGTCERRDVGHGIARPADSVDTLEMQRKGAVSDALKRALRSFGNQFGNSLYDKDHAKPGRAGTQGAQGSAPRPLEPANPASKPQKDSIASMLHQIDDLQAMEFCEDYNIGIQMKADGQHYGVGVEAAGLTGGTHGTASQLIDALLPLVKGAAKGKPAPRGGVEMADPRVPTEEEPAGVDSVASQQGTPSTAHPSPDTELPHPNDIKTIGDLYNAAKDNFKMFPRDVLAALSLKSQMEIANVSAAWKILCDQRKDSA